MAHPLRRSLFDIAIATGSGWDVDGMAARMPLAMWYEWMAYARLQPADFSAAYRLRRQDWNAAMGTTAIVNTARGLAGSKMRPLRIGDVIFPEERARGRKEESPAATYRKLKTMLLLGSEK